MSNSKSPYAYPEVRAVLDAALAAGGAIYTPRDAYGVASEKAVHTFVARANNVRHNLRRIGEAGDLERLILLKRGLDVIIELKPRMQPGDLRALDGTPLNVAAAPTTLTQEDHDLLAELEKALRDD